MKLFKRKIKYHASPEDQRKEILEMEDMELANEILEGLDCDEIPFGRGKFGNFHRNPIITNGKYGTMIYLSKLYFEENKSRLLFHKLGSIKNSLTNLGNIDIFEIMDEEGLNWDILFVDMYHPRRSNKAPEGYFLLEYNEEIGDKNNSLGTFNNCEKFPEGLRTALIADSNPRYSQVEIIVNKLTEGGKKIERPEYHQKMVDSIYQMLKELKEKLED